MKDGKVEGHCELFENGILTLSWMMKDGQRVGRITVYDGGKALFTERWKSILGGDDRKIENSKEGLKLVIRDKNKTMIYQGEFDEELNRHGKGVEYDENGQLKYEGYWDKDELIRIGKEFKGDKMIEFDELSGIDVLSQIPFYVGGYSRVNGEFKRNGIGYLLDKKNGTAIRESKWFNGCEVNGTNLFDGWYVKGMNESIRCVLNGRQPKDVVEKVLVNEKRVEVHNSNELNKMDIDVTSLLISSNSCNELKSLNLNKYRWLKSIEIGDDCLKNVDEFAIDELNNLKSIKIGKNSFTLLKNTSKWDGNKANNNNRSFRILNCGGLESIEIGEYSFCDYGGGFELKNLPKLSTIKIGRIGSRSFNFWSSSFEIKDLPHLNSIEMGDEAFQDSLSTVISNLPHLNSIKLGWGVFEGKNDPSCSLIMENLPNLSSLISVGESFHYPHSVTLSNIPNLQTFILPNSFFTVQNRSVTNVSPILNDLVRITNR